jgi:hypothetical protein
VVEFHLRHTEGLRENQCRFTLSIPFSDFDNTSRLKIFQLAEKIEEQFKIFILPNALPPDSLLIGVYSKSKLNDLVKTIECALGEAETIKTSINKLSILGADLINSLSMTIIRIIWSRAKGGNIGSCFCRLRKTSRLRKKNTKAILTISIPIRTILSLKPGTANQNC